MNPRWDVDWLERFILCASDRPDHPAVSADGVIVSYRDLEMTARRLASVFGQRSAPRVMIALDQEADAYAAMIATAMCGGYHVPVNVLSPLPQLQRMLRLVSPDVIVGRSLKHLAPFIDAKTLVVDPDRISDDVALWQNVVQPHEIAYICYTSGSTGVPKGVIELRDAVNRYVSFVASQITPNDRIAQFCNIAWDLSVPEILAPLSIGATICPPAGVMDKHMPARIIQREQVSVAILVPTTLSAMVLARQVDEDHLRSMRLVIFCGEQLLRYHVETIKRVCPAAEIVNTYGPTEGTVTNSWLRVDNDLDRVCLGHIVSIGGPIPIPGQDLLLMGGKCADEGEIVIIGPQVARGYWNDPERTNEVFRSVRLADGSNSRSYFTGDWAERRDGRLFFKERRDQQVKVRGFRIEVDEVETCIAEHGWPVCCVFKSGETLGAVVQATADTFSEPELRRALSQQIEFYKIPLRVLAVGRMPLNENGKIDRRAAAAWFARHAY
jgi:D-alanine--poly(phosphoribitol) ligase subunit 1